LLADGKALTLNIALHYYVLQGGFVENICVRLDSALAKRIEKNMKEFNYSTKTDFIRDAVRGKLRELEQERSKKKAWESLFAARGSLKGQGKAKTDEEWHKLKEEAGREYIALLEKRFSQK
jgi:metal-responsive CopG/Arc/MetJ family transcriptional regulator